MKKLLLIALTSALISGCLSPYSDNYSLTSADTVRVETYAFDPDTGTFATDSTKNRATWDALSFKIDYDDRTPSECMKSEGVGTLKGKISCPVRTGLTVAKKVFRLKAFSGSPLASISPLMCLDYFKTSRLPCDLFSSDTNAYHHDVDSDPMDFEITYKISTKLAYHLVPGTLEETVTFFEVHRDREEEPGSRIDNCRQDETDPALGINCWVNGRRDLNASGAVVIKAYTKKNAVGPKILLSQSPPIEIIPPAPAIEIIPPAPAIEIIPPARDGGGSGGESGSGGGGGSSSSGGGGGGSSGSGGGGVGSGGGGGGDLPSGDSTTSPARCENGKLKSEDLDCDAVGDHEDNCVATVNSGQEDGDQDKFGDACDACPTLHKDKKSIEGACSAVPEMGCPCGAKPDPSKGVASTADAGNGRGGGACSLSLSPRYQKGGFFLVVSLPLLGFFLIRFAGLFGRSPRRLGCF